MNKRTDVLDAAARVFVQHGYDRASMDQIALEAGASKRTVYNHFPSKEGLFDEVVQRFMTDAHELKRVPYQRDEGLEPQLGRFAHSMRQPTRDPIWLGLMRIITTSPAVVSNVLEQLAGTGDTLASWIQEAAADGRIAVPDPKLAAETFWAMLSGAYLMPAIFASPVPEHQADRIETELVAMFLARYQL